MRDAEVGPNKDTGVTGSGKGTSGASHATWNAQVGDQAHAGEAA